MICERCGRQFTEDWRVDRASRRKPMRFCSRSCANTRKFTPEQNAKKGRSGIDSPAYIDGRTARKKIKDRECAVCGTPITSRAKTGMCNRCYRKNQPKESIERNRETHNEMVRSGRHKGWQSRNITSYPERFFMSVFQNMGVADYFHNHKVCKRDLGIDDDANYFLDFYFDAAKLDIEIDGKQHKRPDRAKSDSVRDKLLNENGIEVYRIEWRNPITDEAKEHMKEEIEKLRALLVDKEVIK